MKIEKEFWAEYMVFGFGVLMFIASFFTGTFVETKIGYTNSVTESAIYMMCFGVLLLRSSKRESRGRLLK